MKWISVKDGLPKNCNAVIALQKYNEKYRPTIIASYARKFELEAGDDIEDWTDYKEDTDQYFCPSGWYEQKINWDEYANIGLMEGEITHWMPLPKPPELEK